MIERDIIVTDTVTGSIVEVCKNAGYPDRQRINDEYQYLDECRYSITEKVRRYDVLGALIIEETR